MELRLTFKRAMRTEETLWIPNYTTHTVRGHLKASLEAVVLIGVTISCRQDAYANAEVQCLPSYTIQGSKSS